MHKRHHLGPFAPDELADFLRIEGFAPGFGEAHHFPALPPGHLAQAVGEESVAEEGELHARFGEIGDGGLHARTAGSRDGQVELVAGGIGISQKRADFIDHLKEERIQVTYYVLRHGGVDPGRHHTGSGAEQQAFRRLQGRISLGHKRLV